MVGIRRRAIILFMTRIAIGRRSRKAIVHMATGAVGLNMGSRQFKIRLVVIERRRCPGTRRMARRTIVVESPGRMIRVRDSGEVILMAAKTVTAYPAILAVLMAEDAVGGLMRSR
jgi:hypothetical protein